jgi:hypothetical protein
MRIEVFEKYPIDMDIDPEYEETLRNLKINTSNYKYGWRRTMILVEQIQRLVEIPGNKKECQLQLFGNETLTIRFNYDEFRFKLHDIEEQMLIEQELIKYEIDQAASRQKDE